MKTILTLLFFAFSIYFITSCKKGDGSAPTVDSTHYNDSVAHVRDSVTHVTDSIALYADSVYNSPFGTYYGSTHNNYHVDGDYNDGTYNDTFSVSKIAGDSILIINARSSGGSGETFIQNSTGEYNLLTGSNGYTHAFEVIVGTGGLQVHERFEYGSSYNHDDYLFNGSKKK